MLISNFVSQFLLMSPCLFITLHFQARLQRGNILLKQGSTQEAREDFEAVVSLKSHLSFIVLQNKNTILKEKCLSAAALSRSCRS